MSLFFFFLKNLNIISLLFDWLSNVTGLAICECPPYAVFYCVISSLLAPYVSLSNPHHGPQLFLNSWCWNSSDMCPYYDYNYMGHDAM